MKAKTVAASWGLHRRYECPCFCITRNRQAPRALARKHGARAPVELSNVEQRLDQDQYLRLDPIKPPDDVYRPSPRSFSCSDLLPSPQRIPVAGALFPMSQLMVGRCFATHACGVPSAGQGIGQRQAGAVKPVWGPGHVRRQWPARCSLVARASRQSRDVSGLSAEDVLRQIAREAGFTVVKTSVDEDEVRSRSALSRRPNADPV